MVMANVNPGKIFFPTTAQQLKTVMKINGATSVSNCLGFTFVDTVTTSPKKLTIIFKNEGELNVSIGDEIEFLADTVSGTTSRFKGYVESIDRKKEGSFASKIITAQDYGIEIVKRKITKKYTTETDIGQIFIDLISDFFPNFSSTGVSTSTGYTAKPVWSDLSAWQCMTELVTRYADNTYDFYFDSNKLLHLVAKSSDTNKYSDDGTDKYCAYVSNIIENKNPTVSKDNANKVTYVRVYGKNISGDTIFASAETSHIPYRRDLMVTDNNLTTRAQCQDKAEKLLLTEQEVGDSGSITIIGDIDIVSGKLIYISHPYLEIDGYYVVSEAKHEYSRDGFFTTIKFIEDVRHEKGIMNIIESLVKKNSIQNVSDNEEGCDDAYVETFDGSAGGSFSDTEEINGKLKIISGKTTGEYISELITTRKTIKKIYMALNGDDLGASKIYISARTTSGQTTAWNEINNRTITAVTTEEKIRYKILLIIDDNNPAPFIDSASLQVRY